MAAGVMAAVALMAPLDARQAPTGACRITGHATSGSTPLPGVALTIKSGTTVKGATSTDVDGSFSFSLTPGQYTLSAELTGFGRVERPISVAEGAGAACAQALDLSMSLGPGEPPVAAAPNPSGVAPVAAPQGTTRGSAAAGAGAATNATGGRGANAANGRGRGAQPGSNGFQTLEVRQSADGAAVADTQLSATETEQAARSLLPPGFSTESSGDAIAINGNTGSIDRGMLQDRFGAIGRGEFDPSNPEGFGAGFGGGAGFGAPGADGQGPGRGGPGGFQGRGGPGGPGGFQGRGGPGGPGGGRGDFFLGGRGAQQQRYQGTVNYSFGGSVLDSAPFQLPGRTADVQPYARNTYGGTIGGPVKLGSLYDGTRKTNFVFTYNGNHGSSVFDQYANVPTAAQRTGDFSALSTALINPATGQPFPNNQVPVSPAAQSLLQYIPQPNVPGTTQSNFHYTTTTPSAGDTINLRVTHNFTPAVAGGGRGGGRGGGGFGGGRGGRGAQAATGTSVNMTAQVQFRRTDSDSTSINPLLGGHNANRSVAVPVTFNIRHKRTMHTATVNFSSTSSDTTNKYSGITDVASNAGIYTGLSDPFTWGVPSLSFSQYLGIRDVVPAKRDDKRLTMSYTWTQPWKTHQFRAGGDVRLDRTSSQSNAAPNGSFTFTGLYTGNDFADFLLGTSQLASQQYGPDNVQLRGRSASLFFQDDWRQSSKLTLSLGLRYELIQPFTEANNNLATLDVNSDFTAAARVIAGQSGPYTGAFPDGILLTDANNVAPRVGLAYRARPGLVLRGGYGMSYNSGSYSTMARQLAAQPPFASSNTQNDGVGNAPIPITTAFTTVTNQLQNNYGVDKNYQLGRVQTWNADVSKDLTPVWVIGGGFTRTTGANLDIVRAPNRNPDGTLRIEDVQAFTWQTSDGISNLNAGTFRLQRRFVKGYGGSLTYTIAKSMDDASNYGGGGTVVAQNDQDLAAEYSLSSFDRRHQVNGNVSFELPFGQNKPWFNNGGFWGATLGGWRGAMDFTWQSGTPLTPRVVGAARDAAVGVTGTLRASVVPGVPVFTSGLAFPQFFNPLAFAVPPVGQFGDAGRNSIIGPGSKLLNAQFSRDVRMGGNRAVTLQATIANLLNIANYAAVDTNIRSATFGQVLSFRPSRSAQLNFRFRF
jgi:trimeric autotransporter adhesin